MWKCSLSSMKPARPGLAVAARCALALSVAVLILAMVSHGSLTLWAASACAPESTDSGWKRCVLRRTVLSSKAELAVMFLIQSMGVLIALIWLFRLLQRQLWALRQSGVGALAMTFRMKARQLASCWFVRKPSDAEAEKLKLLCESSRVQRSSVYIYWGCKVLVPWMLLQSWYHGPRKVVDEGYDMLVDEHRVRDYLYTTDAVPTVLLAGITIVFDMMPSLLTPRNLDCASILLHTLYAWRLPVMKAEDNSLLEYEYNKYWLLAFRILHGFVFGSPRLNMILNGCVVALDLAVMYLVPWESEYQYDWESSRASLSMGREVGVLLSVSMMYWAHGQMELAMAKAFQRAENSDHAFNLVRRLLTCMCDAVARLDSELILTERCPSLSAMLLRHGPIPQGTKLTDLMQSEEDAERFRGRVLECFSGAPQKAAPSNDPALETAAVEESAGLCHVEFKDGSGSRLPVLLYYSCMPTMSGQWSCLVGIQESREEGAGRAPEAPDGGAGAMRALGSLPELGCTARSMGSASSWSGSGLADEGPHVWVDAAGPTLPLLECSGSFSLLGGPAGHCGALSEWLKGSSLQRLCAWLAESPVQGAIAVTLRPHKSWVYRCELSLSDAYEPPDAPSSSRPVCLVLGGLECQGAGCAKTETKDKMDKLLLTLDVSDPYDLPIINVQGGTDQHRADFGAETNLLNWMSPKDFDDFACALEAILDANNEAEGKSQKVGTFTFRHASTKFRADVKFLQTAQGSSTALLSLRIRGSKSSKARGRAILEASGQDGPEVNYKSFLRWLMEVDHPVHQRAANLRAAKAFADVLDMIKVLGAVDDVMDEREQEVIQVYPLEEMSSPLSDETEMAQLLQGTEGDDILLTLTETWVSDVFEIPAGKVDLETIDVAGFVNSVSHVTKVGVSDSQVKNFNRIWREQFVAKCHAEKGGSDAIKEFLQTGRSSKFPLHLRILSLPPNTWFRLHAHPNLEFGLTLAGDLHEVRLMNALVKDFPSWKFPCKSGPWGPNLRGSANRKDLLWEIVIVEKAEFLVNVPGSIHQSFSADKGCTVLVLWSGCHANITPEHSKGVSDLLQPEAGWPSPDI